MAGSSPAKGLCVVPRLGSPVMRYVRFAAYAVLIGIAAVIQAYSVIPFVLLCAVPDAWFASRRGW
jgi:hypothetical protein